MANRIQIESPVGILTLAEENESMIGLLFGAFRCEGEKSALLAEAERQLTAYFAGRLRSFDLPVNPPGTEFQKRVWHALREIPYGETRSYGDIARAVNSPRAYRAVGMANHYNPVSIIVPCHRVIGADGKLTGYGGGLEKKRMLLQIEGIDAGG